MLDRLQVTLNNIMILVSTFFTTVKKWFAQDIMIKTNNDYTDRYVPSNKPPNYVIGKMKNTLKKK